MTLPLPFGRVAGGALVVILAACSSAPGASVSGSPTAIPSAPASQPASSGGPSASVPAAADGSAICEPWLSRESIASVLGNVPAAVVGYNFLNDGQPADCKWTFADGSYLQLFALEQPEYGQVSDYLGADGTRSGGVDYVEDLGIVAFYGAQEGVPSSVNWFPDNDLQLQLETQPTGAAQVISQEQLIALAHLVTIPSPLPVAPGG